MTDHDDDTLQLKFSDPPGGRSRTWRGFAALLLAFSFAVTALVAISPVATSTVAAATETDDQFFQRLRNEAANQTAAIQQGSPVSPIRLKAKDHLQPKWQSEEGKTQAEKDAMNRRWDRNNYPAGTYEITEPWGATTWVELEDFAKPDGTTGRRIKSIEYDLQYKRNWRPDAHGDLTEYRAKNPGLAIKGSIPQSSSAIHIRASLDDAGHGRRSKWGAGNHALVLFAQDAGTNRNLEQSVWERSVDKLVKENHTNTYKIKMDFAYGTQLPGRPTRQTPTVTLAGNKVKLPKVEVKKEWKEAPEFIPNPVFSEKTAEITTAGYGNETRLATLLDDNKLAALRNSVETGTSVGTGTPGGIEKHELKVGFEPPDGLKLNGYSPPANWYLRDWKNSQPTWEADLNNVLPVLGAQATPELMVRLDNSSLFYRVDSNLGVANRLRFDENLNPLKEWVDQNRVALVFDDAIIHVDNGRKPFALAPNVVGWDKERAKFNSRLPVEVYEILGEDLLRVDKVKNLVKTAFSTGPNQVGNSKAIPFTIELTDGGPRSAYTEFGQMSTVDGGRNVIYLRRGADPAKLRMNLLFELHNAAKYKEFQKLVSKLREGKMSDQAFANKARNIELNSVGEVNSLLEDNDLSSTFRTADGSVVPIPHRPQTAQADELFQQYLNDAERVRNGGALQVFKPRESVAARLAAGDTNLAEVEATIDRRLDKYRRLVASDETAEVVAGLGNLRKAAHLYAVADAYSSDDLSNINSTLQSEYQDLARRYNSTLEEARGLGEESTSLLDRARRSADLSSREYLVGQAMEMDRRSVMLLLQSDRMFDELRVASSEILPGLRLPDAVSGNGTPQQVATIVASSTGHRRAMNNLSVEVAIDKMEVLNQRVSNYGSLSPQEQAKLRRDATASYAEATHAQELYDNNPSASGALKESLDELSEAAENLRDTFKDNGAEFEYHTSGAKFDAEKNRVVQAEGPGFASKFSGVVEFAGNILLVYEVAGSIAAIASAENGRVVFEQAAGIGLSLATELTTALIFAAIGGPVGFAAGLIIGFGISFLIEGAFAQTIDVLGQLLFDTPGDSDSGQSSDLLAASPNFDQTIAPPDPLPELLLPVRDGFKRHLTWTPDRGDVGLHGWDIDQLAGKLEEEGLGTSTAYFIADEIMVRYGTAGEYPDILEFMVYVDKGSGEEEFSPELRALLAFLDSLDDPPPPPSTTIASTITNQNAKDLVDDMADHPDRDATVATIANSLAGESEVMAVDVLLASDLVAMFDRDGDGIITVRSPDHIDFVRFLETMPGHGRVVIEKSNLSYPRVGTITTTPTESQKLYDVLDIDTSEAEEYPYLDLTPGHCCSIRNPNGYSSEDLAIKLSSGSGAIDRGRANDIAEAVVVAHGTDRILEYQRSFVDSLVDSHRNRNGISLTICPATLRTQHFSGPTVILEWESCGESPTFIGVGTSQTDTTSLLNTEVSSDVRAYLLEGVRLSVDEIHVRVNFKVDGEFVPIEATLTRIDGPHPDFETQVIEIVEQYDANGDLNLQHNEVAELISFEEHRYVSSLWLNRSNAYTVTRRDIREALELGIITFTEDVMALTPRGRQLATLPR